MRHFDPAAALGIRGRSLSQTDLGTNLGGGINVPVREIILGQPVPRQYLGDLLFRDVPVAWNFMYYKYGVENQSLKDAERGFKAEIQASDTRIDNVTGKLRRYTWASYYDQDEIGIANEAARNVGLPLDIQVKASRDARMIVRLAMEKAKSVVALATASYSASGPDLDDTLAGGSEWDDATNGDSRTTVRSMAARVANANNVQISDIDVILTTAAMQAAQNDPVILARLQYQGVLMPTTAVLAEYWGVNSVQVGDAFAYGSAVAPGTSLYGDVAFFRVRKDLAAAYDTTEGSLDSFVAFGWKSNPGPLSPFYVPGNTTWYFPWQEYLQAVQVNTMAAGILRNVSSAS